MSPASLVPGAAAVQSRPIRSGLTTGCSPGTMVRLYARGWQASSPSSVDAAEAADCFDGVQIEAFGEYRQALQRQLLGAVDFPVNQIIGRISA